LITQSDKNLGLTILDRDWLDYAKRKQIDECPDKFEPKSNLSIQQAATLAKSNLTKAIASTRLCNKTKSQLCRDIVKINHLPRFQPIPKLHKATEEEKANRLLPARPVIAANNAPTTPLSIFVGKKLQQLLYLTEDKKLGCLESKRIVVEDSFTVARVIDKFNDSPEASPINIFTFDFANLYPTFKTVELLANTKTAMEWVNWSAVEQATVLALLKAAPSTLFKQG
jgi:hypothetical protein